MMEMTASHLSDDADEDDVDDGDDDEKQEDDECIMQQWSAQYGEPQAGLYHDF